MWYLISGLLVMYVILRVLIRHAEKKFDRVNAEEIAERHEMSKKYLREERDDLVGLANAIVIVDQQSPYNLRGHDSEVQARIVRFWFL